MSLNQRLAAVVLLAVTLPAWAVIVRHDRNDAEYIRLAERYRAVASVQGLGEGVLIAPRWVLTAAHVAADLPPAGAFVEVNGVRRPVDGIFIHPEHASDERPGNDLALLRLAEPVRDVQPIRPYKGKRELGMQIVIVGRGDTGDGRSGPSRADRRLRAATNVIDDVGEQVLRFSFDAPPAGSKLEGISGPGDSGGPAIVEEDGSLWTVGVSSANASDRSVGPGRYGSTEIYARVSARHEWIEQTMREPKADSRWDAAKWTAALPSTPLGRRVQAFFDAVARDAEAMKAFRLQNRSQEFLASRSEERLAAQESAWLTQLRGARVQGHASSGERALAVFVSLPGGKWRCLIFRAAPPEQKIRGILDSEIMNPRGS